MICDNMNGIALKMLKLQPLRKVCRRVRRMSNIFSMYFSNPCLDVNKSMFSTRFLKQELSVTKAYKETSEEEKSVVNGHCNHLALKFSACVKERQDRLPTMYWLPKLHKRPYKARFIANSSSCTTTELSKLLTSCLTAVKIMS